MRTQYCNGDPIQLVHNGCDGCAAAWEQVGRYFGFDNLDSYPGRMTKSDVHERYQGERFKVSK